MLILKKRKIFLIKIKFMEFFMIVSSTLKRIRYFSECKINKDLATLLRVHMQIQKLRN